MVPNLLLFWLRGAPLRFLSYWLLESSRARTSVGADTLTRFTHPPACDLVNERYSPITVMQQFYAKVLRAGSRWLQVLEKYVNDPTLWPEFKHRFRRHIGQCMCEINRRHSSRFRKWNWSLARLVDNRLPWAERVATAEAALAAYVRRCCMEEDYARRLMAFKFMEDVVSMMSSTAQLVLLSIYWSVNLTTALAECEHARNHHLLHSLNGFHLFAANCANADGKAMLGATGQNTKSNLTVTAAGVSQNDCKKKA